MPLIRFPCNLVYSLYLADGENGIIDGWGGGGSSEFVNIFIQAVFCLFYLSHAGISNSFCYCVHTINITTSYWTTHCQRKCHYYQKCTRLINKDSFLVVFFVSFSMTSLFASRLLSWFSEFGEKRWTFLCSVFSLFMQIILGL